MVATAYFGEEDPGHINHKWINIPIWLGHRDISCEAILLWAALYAFWDRVHTKEVDHMIVPLEDFIGELLRKGRYAKELEDEGLLVSEYTGMAFVYVPICRDPDVAPEWMRRAVERSDLLGGGSPGVEE